MSTAIAQTAISAFQLMDALQVDFNKQNTFGLKFEQECHFAKQQLLKKSFTLETAAKQPDSLRSAILSVAAIGISLNPASGLAYLVPRSPGPKQPAQICLDISYRGMVKLGTDSGSIVWSKAELVYEGDNFQWRGMAALPEHNFDPFEASRVDERNPWDRLRGGYCVAELTGGGYLVDHMGRDEILKVKSTSRAENGPWKTWAGEMIKKTLVKRAHKSWPPSARLDRAIEVVNQHEGLELDPVVDDIPAGITAQQAQTIREALEYAGEPEVEFCRVAGIASVEALSSGRYQGAMTHINNRIARLTAGEQT